MVNPALDQQMAIAFENFRLHDPRGDTNQLNAYLRYLLNCHQAKSLSWWWSSSKQVPAYIFYHDARHQPKIQKIKQKLGLQNWYSEIDAAILFDNFNKPSATLPVGAFTHCLYNLRQGENNEPGKKHKIDNNCYILVTDFDNYVTEDGFEEVSHLLSKENLQRYSDEVLKGAVFDASAIRFVFVCQLYTEKLPMISSTTSTSPIDPTEKLPIWSLPFLACRLKDAKFVPELEGEQMYLFYNTIPKFIKHASWKIMRVNCGADVVENIRIVMSRCYTKFLTFDRLRTIQTELRRFYRNWRVVLYTNEHDVKRHFEVPSIIFKREADAYCWYLMFYAPLEWSDELPTSVLYDCGEESANVKSKFDDYFEENLLDENNFNAVENQLRLQLGYQVSFSLHQSESNINLVIIKHREAYRSINVDLIHMRRALLFHAANRTQLLDKPREPVVTVLHAIYQVIGDLGFKDGKLLLIDILPQRVIPTVSTAIKQLLVNVDNNQHAEKKISVVLCSRNNTTSFEGVENAVFEIGPIKVVIVVSS